MALRHVCVAITSCAVLLGCATTDVTERDASPGFSQYGTSLGAPAAPQSAVVQPSPLPAGVPLGGSAGTGVSSADLAAAGIGASAGSAAFPGAPAGGALGVAAPGPQAPGPGAPPSPIQPQGGAPVPMLGATASPGAPNATARAAAPLPVSGGQPLAGAAAPTRTDIAAFALGTRHSVGETRYRRFLSSEMRASRLCRRYPGADLAQRAFLEAGGPEKDKLGLDPDGDGFACTWSPEPFRAARG